jgi:hypothetical protein
MIDPYNTFWSILRSIWFCLLFKPNIIKYLIRYLRGLKTNVQKNSKTFLLYHSITSRHDIFVSRLKVFGQTE